MLLSCKEEFQKQLQQKDTKHDEEVNLLKADMLVALQVARSGNLPPLELVNQIPRLLAAPSLTEEQSSP